MQYPHRSHAQRLAPVQLAAQLQRIRAKAEAYLRANPPKGPAVFTPREKPKQAL